MGGGRGRVGGEGRVGGGGGEATRWTRVLPPPAAFTGSVPLCRAAPLCTGGLSLPFTPADAEAGLDHGWQRAGEAGGHESSGAMQPKRTDGTARTDTRGYGPVPEQGAARPAPPDRDDARAYRLWAGASGSAAAAAAASPPWIENGARAASPASAPRLPRAAPRLPLCKRRESVRHTLSTSVGARVTSRAGLWRRVRRTGWATAASLPPVLHSPSRLPASFPPPPPPLRLYLAPRLPAALHPSPHCVRHRTFCSRWPPAPTSCWGVWMSGRGGDARGQLA